MTVIKVLLWILLYLAIGAFLDDCVKGYGDEVDEIPSLFIALTWPIPMVMAIVELLSGKGKN